MDYRQEEYREELQKVQDRDFTHSWVSSSAFLFYLSIVCMLTFAFGACSSLFTERYKNAKPDEITVQPSTMYTPKYETPK